MTRATLFVCLCALGCGSERAFFDVDQAPPEVDLFALVAVRDESVVAATPLRALGTSDRMDLEAEDAEVFALGFSSADLPPIPEGEADVPLMGASSCELALGAPRWIAHAGSEDSDSIDPATVPPLTASWLRDRPYEDWESWLVDLRCTEGRCLEAVRRVGCDVELELPGCQIGEISASMNREGVLSIHPIESPIPCVPADAKEGALASADCTFARDTTCSLDIYRPQASLPFDVETISLVPGAAPRTTSWWDQRHSVAAGGSGFLQSVVRLGDRLIVLESNGQFLEETFYSCTDGRPKRLLSLDLESLEVVSTATVPPCFFHLHAFGDQEILAMFREAPGSSALSIGRFSPDGRQLARAAVPEPTDALGGWYVYSVVIPPDLSFATAQLAWGVGNNDDRVGLASWSLPDLTPNGGLQVRDGDRRPGPAVFTEDVLLIVDNESDVLEWIEPITGVRIRPAFRIPHANSATQHSIFAQPDGHLIATTTPFDVRQVSLLDREMLLDTIGIYFDDAGPLEVVPLGSDEDSLLVGAMSWDPEQPQAMLSIVSRSRSAFLPGAETIGFGPVTPFVSDGKGRWISLLPWEGKLIRITPR